MLDVQAWIGDGPARDRRAAPARRFGSPVGVIPSRGESAGPADAATRASGGIGRRAGFRCQCPKGRGGSTPPSRTNDDPRAGLRAHGRSLIPGRTVRSMSIGTGVALVVIGAILYFAVHVTRLGDRHPDRGADPDGGGRRRLRGRADPAPSAARRERRRISPHGTTSDARRAARRARPVARGRRDSDREAVRAARARHGEPDPGIIALKEGPSVSPEGLERGHDYGFVVTFDDAAARDAYLPHPEHLAAADRDRRGGGAGHRLRRRAPAERVSRSAPARRPRRRGRRRRCRAPR